MLLGVTTTLFIDLSVFFVFFLFFLVNYCFVPFAAALFERHRVLCCRWALEMAVSSPQAQSWGVGVFICILTLQKLVSPEC